MDLVLITGLSGSGKSVALRYLEDEGYYCVDNLPANLLEPLIAESTQAGHTRLAISMDARSSADFEKLHDQIVAMRTQGREVHSVFLTANDDTLVQRFSETRRRHPLSREINAHTDTSLKDSIALERTRLAPLISVSAVIDTSALKAKQLQQYLQDILGLTRSGLTVLFQSFGFKHGLPVDADFVFDARCLPNPYYDLTLRPLSGLDAPVQEFLRAQADTLPFIDDIEQFIKRWLPKFEQDDRSYLTIAIGCTGGQHRSVYIAQTLAERMVQSGFRRSNQVLVRHRTMKTQEA
jgi:UPF0042 nucleotide-binding protein